MKNMGVTQGSAVEGFSIGEEKNKTSMVLTPASLKGSLVSCGGTGWKRLCPAQGSPSHLLAETPTANSWTGTPRIPEFSLQNYTVHAIAK